MKRIDDLKHDVKDVSENVLGDLSTEERIRTFAKKAAEGNDDLLEQLADTAPRKEYRVTDLEYLNGIKKLGAVSLQARHELQTLYQLISKKEEKRDKYASLMLLNESLSRLSRGAFDIDQFGDFDAPEHDDAEYAYGKKSAPTTAYLATKYRDLWEDVPAELLVDEDDRSGTTKLFPALGAESSLAYQTDLSGEAYDALPRDRGRSEVYEAEVQLLLALITFRTRVHGWRLFAEEYLGLTLDEFLGVSALDERSDLHDAGAVEITEQFCDAILSMNEDYIEAYPALLEESADLFDDVDEEGVPDVDEIEVNLDARAENFAEGIADAVDLPGATPEP